MSILNNQMNPELFEGKNGELIEGMLKTLTELSNDLNNKRSELEKLRTKIKEGKFNYNQEVKIYQKLNQEIIAHENKKGEIENSISKIKKKQFIFYSSLTKEFLLNLIESFKKFKIIFTHFIGFSGYSQNKEIDFISIVFRDEHELKYIIEYSLIFQSQLFKNNKEKFENIKNNINNFKQENSIPYPFEIIFENMNNIYKLIDLNSQKEELNESINKKIEEKNKIFIVLKKIEGTIVSNDKLFQEMKNYVKNINSIFDNYQSIKKKNDVSNYLQFVKKVKEFNPSTFNKINNGSNSNIDININSMTVQSEYSEDKNDCNFSRKFLTNKHNLLIVNPKVDISFAFDKNLNKILFSKTHSKTTSRTSLKVKSSQIHKLKKKKIIKSRTPNISYLKDSKLPIRKTNKTSYNEIKKFTPFPITNYIQKTIIKKKNIKQESSSDNEKTERNDQIITNLIRNDLIFNDLNIPFSIDNDSVCDEVSPFRQDKFKISKLVIKNENGKCSPIINRGINHKQQTNIGDLRIERKVYSNECCMSCT